MYVMSWIRGFWKVADGNHVLPLSREDYLDVFAPAVLAAHVPIGEPYYGMGLHASILFRRVEWDSRTWSQCWCWNYCGTGRNYKYPLRHAWIFGAQRHYLHNTFHSFHLHTDFLSIYGGKTLQVGPQESANMCSIDWETGGGDRAQPVKGQKCQRTT